MSAVASQPSGSHPAGAATGAAGGFQFAKARSQGRDAAFSALATRVKKSPHNGAVLMWGSNTYYQIGDEKQLTKQMLHLLPDPAIDVKCGTYHTIVLTARGQIFGCGNNCDGQLGVPAGNVPIVWQLQSLRSDDFADEDAVLQIACGVSHSAILTESGKVLEAGRGVWAWNEVPLPKCAGSKSIKQLVCFGYKTAILCEDGSVWCWGSLSSRGEPTLVAELSDKRVCRIYTGFNEIVALIDSGEVIHWSSTGNTSPDAPQPLLKIEGQNFCDLSSSRAGFAALTQRRDDIWSWKTHPNGETKPPPTPTGAHLFKGKLVRSLALGEEHCACLLYDTKDQVCNIAAYGNNSFSQLGLPESVKSASKKNPRAIAEIQGVEFSTLVSGGYHNVAIVGPWAGTRTVDLALHELLLTGILADVELRVPSLKSEKIWRAHRSLVECRCKGLSLEPSASAIVLDGLVSSDVREEHVEAALEYLYTGYTTFASSSVDAILAVATRLALPGLVAMCEARRRSSSSSSSNPHSSAQRLKSDLKSLYSNRQSSSDVAISATDGTVPAHRCILAARSKFFSNGLKSGSKQLSLGEKGFSTNSLEAMLEYVYTDSFGSVVDGNLDSVLKLAHLLELLPLFFHCEKRLCKLINEANAVEYRNLAFSAEATMLKEATASFMERHPTLRQHLVK